MIFLGTLSLKNNSAGVCFILGKKVKYIKVTFGNSPQESSFSHSKRQKKRESEGLVIRSFFVLPKLFSALDVFS